MKRFLSLLGLVLIAAVGTFLLIPYILSPETIREAMSDQLEAATGRKVTFSGPASLSVFPNLNVRISGVTVANAPGMGAEPLAAMDGLSASIRLFPLLAGSIEFDRLVLVRPRFNLVVGKTGQQNWRLGEAAPAAGGAGQAPQQGPARAPGPAARRAISFDEFLIHDGQLAYRDLRSGATHEASSINATITLPAASGPLNAAGNLVWRGEVINFSSRFSDPMGLASGGRSNAEILLDTNRVKLNLSGVLSMAADLAIDGQINLSTPSVKALARWFDMELPVAGGLSELNIKSKLIAGGPKLSFSEATLTMDGNMAEGAVIVKFGQPRPLVQATLALATLDLNPYLPPKPAPGNTGGGSGPAGNGWRSKPIELAGLGTIDADIRLSASKISAGSLPLGGGALTVALKDRILTAQVAQLKAYGGEINGTLTVDASRSTPLFALKGSAQKAEMQPLLRDFANFDRLKGVGDLTVNLSSAGASEKAVAGGLQGNVQLAARNGAVTGMDLAEIVRALRDRRLDNWRTDRSKETKFDNFQASYFVERGIARNDDLLLTGPSLRASGTGVVDVPDRKVEYRVTAALIDARTATEGTEPKIVLQLPLVIRGPWDSPTVYPDAAGLIETVPGAKESLENAAEALGKGDVKGAVDALKKNGINGLLDALKGKK